MKAVHKDHIVLQLENDVREWISMQKENEDLITDERDLQVKLAIFLQKSEHYERVFTEYRIPFPLLQKRLEKCKDWKETSNPSDAPNPIFPWDNDISVDIVVESGEKFACLELKYTTLQIEAVENVFGEPIDIDGIRIIKSQGASNLIMYNYWKDVRRIEALEEAYPNVAGGVALIITNNPIYWKGVEGSPKYKSFSTSQKEVKGSLKWGEGTKKETKHPNFKLSGKYSCKWDDTQIPILTRGKSKNRFRYMLNAIR